jgi:GntR family transcriptional regulator
MVDEVRISSHSDVPIYRQIVTQLAFLIEAGDLDPGQALPSSRLLADNLKVNRNTVARAYAELADLGLVEGRGRAGTVVVGATDDARATVDREAARDVLRVAVRRCLELGLSPAEVGSLAAGLAERAAGDLLSVCFVECNEDRAKYFAAEIEDRVGVAVSPLVLGDFDASSQPADLVITTFFHLAEVRGLMRRTGTEVVAIVFAPHVSTLVQIASVPQDRRVGIWYSTDDQATTIRDSLAETGIHNVTVLHGSGDAELDAALADVDLVVIPTEAPDLRERLEGRVKVIEWGNVLDAASVRMVAEVVGDMQAAKRDGGRAI